MQYSGVELQDTRRLRADAVVVATGTFLNGLIHTGRRTYTAGRAGEPASIELAESLKQLGFPVGRLKTGTPPRLDGRTIDWDAFEPQPADERPVPFSFSTETIEQPQITCFIGYTNEDVHDSIRSNIHESPLYSGQIKGVGPRYCPSIEDKVVKFPDKTRHQLFLEPEGHDTYEVYLNGFSTSLPAEFQQELVHQDSRPRRKPRLFVPVTPSSMILLIPRDLRRFFRRRRIQGLFFAGQINGTTGYEEAACQGFIAGINAALFVQGREGFRLRREESYIGVLIDDLITHGVDEPYRMFTSRAEHRLSLRHDTADARLSPYGRELGLVGDSSWDRFNQRLDRIARLKTFLEETRLKRSDERYQDLSHTLGRDLGDSVSLAQLSQHPNVDNEIIFRLLPFEMRSSFTIGDFETALADILYSGYIQSQRQNYDRLYQHDKLEIPLNFKFSLVSGLSREMVERLERSQPQSFGQARLIPGMTPAALFLLLYQLKHAKAA